MIYKLIGGLLFSIPPKGLLLLLRLYNLGGFILLLLKDIAFIILFKLLIIMKEYIIYL